MMERHFVAFARRVSMATSPSGHLDVADGVGDTEKRIPARRLERDESP